MVFVSYRGFFLKGISLDMWIDKWSCSCLRTETWFEFWLDYGVSKATKCLEFKLDVSLEVSILSQLS